MVVKRLQVATVDIASDCVLRHNIVCTNPDVLVYDWRTMTPGITSLQDIVAARQDSHKIFDSTERSGSLLIRALSSSAAIFTLIWTVPA